MSDQAEDPEAAADRLEAALERIARISAVRPVAPLIDPAALDHSATDRPDEELSVSEIAERLDSLIARLRAALGTEAKTQ
jgi:hypothetical protein